MLKLIDDYLRSNNEVIIMRFNDCSDNELRLGYICNVEIDNFYKENPINELSIDLYEAIKLRSDFCIKLLELYNTSDTSIEKAKYKLLHKGTPFYFIGLGRLLIQDYQGFSFYMDMAVVQDNKNMSPVARNKGSAAEKAFLGYDEYPQNLIDNTINKYVFGLIERTFKIFKESSPESTFTLSDFKNKFVINNIRDVNSLYHSVVCSFYSWIHECDYFLNLFKILPPDSGFSGSMDSYYLHLVKGTLVLESIAKMVVHKTTNKIISGTLGDLFNNHLNIKLFSNKIDINQNFDGEKIQTLEKILEYVQIKSTFDKVDILKIALTIRNTVSHSLNWNTGETFYKIQRDLYLILTNAIFIMIELLP